MHRPTVFLRSIILIPSTVYYTDPLPHLQSVTSVQIQDTARGEARSHKRSHDLLPC
jgi:hypothetical protein